MNENGPIDLKVIEDAVAGSADAMRILSGRIEPAMAAIGSAIGSATTALSHWLQSVKKLILCAGLEHMPDQLELVLAIRENPENEFKKALYADWLEENGNADAAELIRLIHAKERNLNTQAAAAGCDGDPAKKCGFIAAYLMNTTMLEIICPNVSKLGSIMRRIDELANEPGLCALMEEIDYGRVKRAGFLTFERRRLSLGALLEGNVLPT
jgi:uncharacterized protein (TIGR02996 family)